MERITVDFVPNLTKPVECHASQNDNGRKIEVKLTNAGEPYHLTETDTVQLRVKTSGGDSITQEVVNTHDDFVTITATRDMTATSGLNACVLKLTNATRRASTATFYMRVEPKP